MIYVSSSCSKQKRIGAAIRELAEHGFQNIELSGGTEYYEGYEDDIFDLKEKYNLNFLVHNYFPPPQIDFVLNLASTNDDIYNRSIQQVQNAIQLAEKLNTVSISVHAGFLVELNVRELGNPFAERNTTPRINALNKFAEALNLLFKTNKNKTIYIENNVLSLVNYKTYNNCNPFLLTCNEDYCELYSKVKFNLLLDIGHLKVSCNTLNIDFQKELANLISKTDYVHLSDNDGLTDSNESIKQNSELHELLSRFDLKNKKITLELNQDTNEIMSTYELVHNLIQ